MTYTRVVTNWSGFAGAPGYTGMNFGGTLDTLGAQAAAQKQADFFNAIKAYLPTDVSLSWDGVAQTFDGTGQLIGEVTYTPPASFSGTGTGSYSAPSGAVVNWITNAFLKGRRVRGRSYLVPLVQQAYQNDGTLSVAFLAAVRPAAEALVAGAPDLVIHGGDDSRGYVTSTVSGSSVPDRAAVLRSRRGR